MGDNPDILERARSGDRPAFDALVEPALPKVRAIVWRMIGHPEDCEDVVQDALVKAWGAIKNFKGDSQFLTWLVSIATRAAIDHLRAQKRWRRESQVAYARRCEDNEEWSGEVIGAVAEPEFTFDAKEHVAYCFVCVSRSLPPDEQAALLLRDVMEFSNREAANVLGTSESVLRHRLSAARTGMEQRYDGLCALVNKNGMCRQCNGLGNAAVAVGSKKASLPDIDSMADRMATIRQTDPNQRHNANLHDVFFRRCKQVEVQEDGPVAPGDC